MFCNERERSEEIQVSFDPNKTSTRRTQNDLSNNKAKVGRCKKDLSAMKFCTLLCQRDCLALPLCSWVTGFGYLHAAISITGCGYANKSSELILLAHNRLIVDYRTSWRVKLFLVIQITLLILSTNLKTFIDFCRRFFYFPNSPVLSINPELL